MAKAITFILTLALLVPLCVFDNLFFPFITSKSFVFRTIVEVAFGLWLILIISNKNYRPRFSWILGLFSLFMVSVFISDLLSPNFFKAFWSNYERMEGYVTLLHFFAYFLVFGSVVKSKLSWANALMFSLGVSVFISFYGFLQLAGELVINQGGVRVDGTLGNAAYFATLMLFNIFFTLYLWLSENGSIKKISIAVSTPAFIFFLYYLSHIAGDAETKTLGLLLALFALAVGVVALIARKSKKENLQKIIFHFLFAIVAIGEMILLYYSATRGAILGFLGGIILASLIIVFKEKENKTLKKISYAILIFIVVVVALFQLVKNTSYVTNHPVLSRFSNISWSETKTQARAYIWPMALEGFKEKPIFGWGQEGFNYVFQKYYNPQMVRHEPWFDRTHNTVLDWLVSGGIVGALLYVLLFAVSAYLVLRKNNFILTEKALLIGLLAGYFFQNLFIFDNLTSYVFFGLILAIIHERSSAENKPILENQPEIKSPIVSWVGFIFIILILILVNRKPYFQNLTLIKAIQLEGVDVNKSIEMFDKALAYDHMGNTETREQLIQFSSNVNRQQNVTQEVKMSLAQKVLSQYEKQFKDAPLESRSYLIFSSYLNDFGAGQMSLQYISKGIELAPNKQHLLILLGIAQINTGQNDLALETFKKTYELNTSFFEAARLYGLALLATGKEKEAYDILLPVARSGEMDERTVRAYVSYNKQNQIVSLLEEAIKANPKDKNGYIFLSSVYFSFKQKVKSLEILELMAQNNPELKAEADEYIKSIKEAK